MSEPDYTQFSTDELLTALEFAGRSPVPDLIQACLERQAELTAGLLKMLSSGLDEGWDEDDPRWYREIHAGLLLCAFEEPAALPVFAQIYRDEEREALTEWFSQGIPNYGPAATQTFIDLLQDESAYEFARVMSTEILANIAWHYPTERECVLVALRAQLPSLGEDGTLILPSPDHYQELWTWVVSALADLRDTVSQPQAIALFKQGLIDEVIIGGLKDYLAGFKPGAPAPSVAWRDSDILNHYEDLYRETALEAKRWTRLEKQRGVAPRSAEPRTQAKVGRNDPCPCGSGRKYKHCCGKKR